MTVWAGVEAYKGQIERIRVFKTRELAKAWFSVLTEDLGGTHSCKQTDYEITERGMYFHNTLSTGKTEIRIEPVELEE